MCISPDRIESIDKALHSRVPPEIGDIIKEMLNKAFRARVADLGDKLKVYTRGHIVMSNLFKSLNIRDRCTLKLVVPDVRYAAGRAKPFHLMHGAHHRNYHFIDFRARIYTQVMITANDGPAIQHGCINEIRVTITVTNDNHWFHNRDNWLQFLFSPNALDNLDIAPYRPNLHNIVPVLLSSGPKRTQAGWKWKNFERKKPKEKRGASEPLTNKDKEEIARAVRAYRAAHG
jgi:hypothetical protein